MRTVRLLKSGNRLVVDSDCKELERALRLVLSYRRRVTEGEDGATSVREYRSHVWAKDIKNRIFTCFGYFELVVAAIKKLKYDWELVDLAPRNDNRFEADWNALSANGFVPRTGQLEALAILAAADNGVICCTPGWGKGAVIGAACAMFPKARIAIVTYSQKLMRQRLISEVWSYCPSAGVYHGNMKRKGHRVNLYTVGCLDYADFENTDIVLIDEVHQLATDRSVEKLVRFANAKMFGFSATVNKRWDRGDFRLRGLCGPVRLVVTRAHAEAMQAVVPTYVLWRSFAGVPPLGQSYFYNRTQRLRSTYWDNEIRNSAIAADAQSYSPDTQVLVYTHTVEHALALKDRLPDFTVVYSASQLTGRRKRMAEAMGLSPMTDERYQRIARAFEVGDLRKAICTTCWSTGVDFKQLSVLVRADGGQSAVENGQVTGRPSRAFQGKTYATIRDYCDEFDDWALRRAEKRRDDYRAEGLRNVVPKGAFVSAKDNGY